MINIIDVNLKFKKPFEKISNRSKNYNKKCFDVALDILKKQEIAGLINGPISKKHFLKKILWHYWISCCKTKLKIQCWFITKNYQFALLPLIWL